ncbi:hypothetical protein [Streptomyces sp. DSM 40750]|uniref:hypothetical protein n=1 Tax=Streptomyces sp. DSM 40750 TaxID=2801030 RepID=UPI00214C1F31|nr:hypothetical protein [Streptomyces sp. DSM 40750]UUU24787.1 hypothetical protein JIX55_33555 [Streptomyces sp. DSM 40750]
MQHNRRVAALIQVICLALLVFCLIERQVRRTLGPEETMTGLYPDNRRVRPTAPRTHLVDDPAMSRRRGDSAATSRAPRRFSTTDVTATSKR